ncbi:hypothetical protein EJ05DRAFT_466761 [Pseudovirgaria hyperparasitica]|uniref:D-3-phosphoglycerate dehydrogenase n=1 Tax=Pseudovirgaria hyperparasitica TaxID=470096 RepID=A0A6A6W4E7_9PEZI|nr:uncharacterized protein EJ05DRAFT_466761 [Pseudovirgaria hyperparasitica]KAF2756437.1 hypothetical protein EJ05DRAFT_466761 [Pseudovirgaria hyperparasitica]
MPPKVYVVDPYHKDAIALLKEHNDIDLVLPSDPAKANYHQDATAIIVRSQTRIEASDIEKSKRTLKYIIKQGVGVDNIDVQAAKAHGVKVYNTPGLNGEAVAELTLSLALSVSRRIAELDRRIRNGEVVVRSEALGRSLFRKTIGLIGMGNIGLFVARKWISAMEGRIIAYDPYAKDGAWEESLPNDKFKRTAVLDELLQTADVISLHVPLLDSTRNMLSTREFELMKQDTILLNCARGGIVDESAMLVALKSGKLFGAGLDALAIEPASMDNYGNTLLTCPNVVVTPHVGASTAENQSQSGIAVVNILFELLKGNQPAGCLT